MSPTSSSHTIDAPNSALTHRISPEHISKLMKHTTAVGCFINKQEGLLLRDVRPPSHTLSITVCVHYCTLLMLCELYVKCGIFRQTTHTHQPITVAATDVPIIPVVMVILTAKASFVALKGEKSFMAENRRFVTAWKK